MREPLFTVCGTPTYVAPEILAESGYGVKVKTTSYIKRDKFENIAESKLKFCAKLLESKVMDERTYWFIEIWILTADTSNTVPTYKYTLHSATYN